MNHGAKRVRNGLLQAAMATASLISWLAGSAGADGITPPAATAAAAAGAARGTATAVDAGGTMNLGLELFVCAVLLVTALCFGWLLYLMLTAPPEDETADPDASAASREKGGRSPGVASLLQLLPGAAAPVAADFGPGRLLGRLFRAWIGARLGHPGPM